MRINGMEASNAIRNQADFPNANAVAFKLREFPEKSVKSDVKEEAFSGEVIFNAVEKANRALSPAMRRLEFAIHEATNNIMVKVIDTNTDEVIREFPPEKILDMIAKMWEMAGIIVDERR